MMTARFLRRGVIPTCARVSPVHAELMRDLTRNVVQLVSLLQLPQPHPREELPFLLAGQPGESREQLLNRHAASALAFFLAAATARRRIISFERCSGVIFAQKPFCARDTFRWWLVGIWCFFGRPMGLPVFSLQPARRESLPSFSAFTRAQRAFCASLMAFSAFLER
jgi:hypothetical protein